ncbi:hypothetical protein Pgy4_24168 [Pseudomonas savastanoi pv. glycinea str. race 4]|uniref:Uncharacterized protein n=1 Tax=Pseudomonas savastanoi pv. glycinea str. race 4 TaxID=875330 RepID=F3CA87_PSESG|nr:hypothetical protein Pgy4_24168 [Pseudomonas savastanoi pv. glycinea str. race 4]
MQEEVFDYIEKITNAVLAEQHAAKKYAGITDQ